MSASPQHFFVGNKYLGSRLIPTMRIVPGLDIRPHYSQVYFCMRCGDIWAKIMHEKAPLTQCTIRPCKAHGDGRISCRDTWLDMPTRVEADWPRDALIWEFNAFYELMSCDLVSPGV